MQSIYMSRKIKFRGKRIDYNEWVYGSLISYKNGTRVIIDEIHERAYPVHPDSVGQLTGLTDKNGKEIYEGDIVRGKGQVNSYLQVIEFVNSAQTSGRGWVGRNIIQEENVVFKTERKKVEGFSYFCWPAHWEVVGNVFDNPNLLIL